MTGTNVPKPDAFKRRRNAVPAAHAVRRLPLAGRTDKAPTPPVQLGPAGWRWWRWAWATPQATTWTHHGFIEPLVKRAELEDQWSRAEPYDKLKLLPLLTRLDEQFGFTPRSAAQLHLAFEDPPEPETEMAPVTDVRDRLKGLG